MPNAWRAPPAGASIATSILALHSASSAAAGTIGIIEADRAPPGDAAPAGKRSGGELAGSATTDQRAVLRSRIIHRFSVRQPGRAVRLGRPVPVVGARTVAHN